MGVPHTNHAGVSINPRFDGCSGRCGPAPARNAASVGFPRVALPDRLPNPSFLSRSSTAWPGVAPSSFSQRCSNLWFFGPIIRMPNYAPWDPENVDSNPEDTSDLASSQHKPEQARASQDTPRMDPRWPSPGPDRSPGAPEGLGGLAYGAIPPAPAPARLGRQIHGEGRRRGGLRRCRRPRCPGCCRTAAGRSAEPPGTSLAAPCCSPAGSADG